MKLRTLFAGVVLSLLLVTAWAADPQIYFSRKDPVSQVLVREISAARKTIYVMMYSFTDAELADALVSASNRGVDVRIVFDRTQSSEKNSITTGLVEKLGSKKVVFRSGKGRGVMHQKMAIYDGLTVTLGSYNWTNNAKNNNWENLIVLRDAKIATECTQEFQRIWNSPAPGSGRATKSETKKK
ncbi:MAG: phospholipase D-like domain-containing protein [Candidatus Didemnitutus sp.]|nr:phospholipase D-like domain-containing protein [Candidatus Didemnitutus sp.]